MDGLAELRDVWHRFASGQVGPDVVVGAAQRACTAGAHNSAPTLLELANVQPAQYAHVPQIFDRVRGELQAAAARAAQSQQQAAYAVGGAVAAAPPTGYAPPPQAYGSPPPAGYGAPGAYPMQQGYPAPAPAHPPSEPGMPPGVHGLTLKQVKDLRRTGWICIAASFLIGLFAIVSISNGSKLSKHGDSQGTPMMIVGWVMLGLGVLSGLMMAAGG